MISVCVATYKAHPAPNLTTLGPTLAAAFGAEPGELCVALNGISAEAAGVPAGTRSVPLPVNKGVAPGWNAAASVATGDVLVFLNDDCEPGSGSLARLARVLRDDDASGVVGPGGSFWSLATGERERERDFDAHDETPGTRVACDVVDGHCFAVRRATYDALGGFDEFYAPASWEEVDFCTAARAHGLTNYAVAGVDVAHEWGISAKSPPWRRIAHNGRKELLWSIHRRNRSHFIAKFAGSSLHDA